ncbi:hypothetical protein GGS23DRAFT_554109 [Durotheca rogersii]|uniref:uncharacterized protein n=1 Tax=Durotheca rogersii TaxID=419775 RepID=UPI00221F167E|nr:uncharacterized protein GGS23DRAFT_554109 [Durotheca rogersii]KAI5865775.1 hypothetical protein GGS23DRAFT_554109 [Durotheca rogersii]
MHTFGLKPAAAVAAVACLGSLPAAQAALYLKSSPVVQVDAKDYDRIINQSNHTSVVEFYAPWCGHCQNLKPAYEKAARNLEGLAHVAAVNCDDDANKQLCSALGVKGFPTLKTVRPGKGKGAKPLVEDYNGPRTAKGIVDAVVERINNHVKRVTDNDLDAFLAKNNESAKALLFTEKGTTSALLRSIAIDFLDVITVAQVRDKETRANELFGVASYPTLVLLPGGDRDGLVYDGEMKKDALVKFLSQAGSPNVDPAPASAKPAGEKKNKKKAAKPSDKDKKAKKASSAKPSAETEAAEPADEEETPVDAATAKPVEAAPPIPAITDADELAKQCLNRKAHTCVLAFVPAGAHADEGSAGSRALASLAALAHKHALSSRRLFPFFEVAADGGAAAPVLAGLGLAGEIELVALSGKRGWWRRYEGADFGLESVEAWIDAIRLSEGVKHKLPEGLIAEEEKKAEETKAEETKAEETRVEEKEEEEEKPAETPVQHEEL